uniref:Cuticular protein n=1 Tax=Monochamus alternatus TaxID=192382 RepID=U3RCT2_MONAT|nr:cuticular protein [Monochamus alternatus]
MKKLSVLFVAFLVCHVQSATDVPASVVPIISETIALETDGNFHYSYETGDGIKAHEEGNLKKVNDELVETVSGGWEYTAPDGKPISISYVADETGYHPTGDSIPVAPPIPEPIAKLIQYLEAHPQLQEVSGEATS